MSDTLVEINGEDTSGTTEYVYYYDVTTHTYTLLGSTNNDNAATVAQTGTPLATYAVLIYVPPGDVSTAAPLSSGNALPPTDSGIVVLNQAGTVQDPTTVNPHQTVILLLRR